MLFGKGEAEVRHSVKQGGTRTLKGNTSEILIPILQFIFHITARTMYYVYKQFPLRLLEYSQASCTVLVSCTSVVSILEYTSSSCSYSATLGGCMCDTVDLRYTDMFPSLATSIAKNIFYSKLFSSRPPSLHVLYLL